MRDLLRVMAAYEEIDGLIQEKIADATTTGHAAERQRWVERKELSDYAFYVVLFAQFERIAKDKFIGARDRRAANPNWIHRRPWDADLFRDADRVGFSTRLAAILDRNTPLYGRVMHYYADRNSVAHGGLSNRILSIDVFFQDLLVIIGHLRA